MTQLADADARVEILCGDLAHIHAPRGTELNAGSWQTEAPLRMLLNNLDAEVAEHPEQLVVYGGSGRAARSPEALRAIVRVLLRLRGAQPLAAKMAGAAILCVEVDPSRIRRRLESRYLDEWTESLDDALERVRCAAAERRPLSVALLGNAAEVVPELARRGARFDLVTDQTAAHDPLNGYVPAGVAFDDAAGLRRDDPERYLELASASIVAHVEALVALREHGAHVFDYGNDLRGEAQRAGYERAFDYPGFVAAYLRPLFCRGIG